MRLLGRGLISQALELPVQIYVRPYRFVAGSKVSCRGRRNRAAIAQALDKRLGCLEMIVVIGRVRTDADKRAELIRIGQTIATASRLEAGCISYRLYQDVENENEFVFVEEWDSDEALRQHFATSHVAAFMQAVPATIVGPPDVKFHTIASSTDLADVSG